MRFSSVTLADWRAQVDKELAGASFDKALVHKTLEGLTIAPLYTEAPGEPLAREARIEPFRVCMRHAEGAKAGELAADIEGGADALWLSLDERFGEVLARPDAARLFFVLDAGGSGVEALARVEAHLPAEGAPRFALGFDPIGARASGRAPMATLPEEPEAFVHLARTIDARFPGACAAMVSTLPYHDAGADAADEIAIALATATRYLKGLVEAGFSAEKAAGLVAVQVSVGRETFFELCKLRALRVGWQKLLTAFGATDAPPALVHAVCSSRTLTLRDPWVNMLRSTTQAFSAILGGADLVTPSAFDQAFGTTSDHGRRVARNTGLVLREESFLGKVSDPAGGSYYLDTLTDALAREAWKRFQAIERAGGVVEAITTGRLRARLEATWVERLDRVAKRKTSILGVTDFANLDEKLSQAPRSVLAPAGEEGALLAHRDAEAFEELRTRADSLAVKPEALLVTLGPLAESRPRVGFASGFFSAGGIRTREGTDDEKVALACVCGTDERYATEAVARVRALKAAGCGQVLIAGRPGALEPSLREAGADGFIFVGCDLVATLSTLLDHLA